MPWAAGCSRFTLQALQKYCVQGLYSGFSAQPFLVEDIESSKNLERKMWPLS